MNVGNPRSFVPTYSALFKPLPGPWTQFSSTGIRTAKPISKTPTVELLLPSNLFFVSLFASSLRFLFLSLYFHPFFHSHSSSNLLSRFIVFTLLYFRFSNTLHISHLHGGVFGFLLFVLFCHSVTSFVQFSRPSRLLPLWGCVGLYVPVPYHRLPDCRFPRLIST